LEDVFAGQFIIEYVGEVISNEECQRRMEKHQNDKKFYYLTVDGQECIDARMKGNLARFINHSCNPNCVTQKWLVFGEIRVGLFADKDIKAGTELTFDYKFERFGVKKQKCYCGEENCRGYLGEKPKQIKKEKKKQEVRKVIEIAPLDKRNIIIDPQISINELLQTTKRIKKEEEEEKEEIKKEERSEKKNEKELGRNKKQKKN